MTFKKVNLPESLLKFSISVLVSLLKILPVVLV